MKIIGHRGCPLLEPENTIKGFKKAAALGVDYVELDVYQCLTGEIIVFHDPKIDKLTNGKGLIHDLTLKELQQFRVGKEKIPLLEDVFKALDNKVKIIVELKGWFCEKKVVDLVEKHKQVGNVIVSSFIHPRLDRVKKLNPDIKIAYTTNRVSAKHLNKHPDQLHVRGRFVNKKLLKAAHEKGIEVFAWTINTKKAAKKLIDLEVDGIITDDPRIVK